MFGWILVIIVVLAIFNAERLPALRQQLEEKLKGSVVAAKEGSKLAKDKIQKVKTDIENKKTTVAQAEAEENTPEEIAESMEFMGTFVQEHENKKSAKSQPKKTEKKVETEEKQDSADDGKVTL
ncbi:MAG: hypothetical protein IJ099_02200 [Alphaproteobacteria bacterium]|nr:hypothetical protein [Alphaproteobacteria bacterium]